MLDQKLLTARELANLMKVSLRQVWRWRDAGTLPVPLNIGGARCLRWDGFVIAKWIADGTPDVKTTGWTVDKGGSRNVPGARKEPEEREDVSENLLWDARMLARKLSIDLKSLKDLLKHDLIPKPLAITNTPLWRVSDIYRWVSEQTSCNPMLAVYALVREEKQVEIAGPFIRRCCATCNTFHENHCGLNPDKAVKSYSRCNDYNPRGFSNQPTHTLLGQGKRKCR